MIYKKSCPKCGGDVKRLTDFDEDILNCLQCGYTKYGIVNEKRESLVTNSMDYIDSPYLYAFDPAIFNGE